MNYYTIIGLEIHVQPKTKTKLFCSCSTKYTDEPNTNVCPICLGMPGAMPYLNEEALKKAVLIGLSLNCDITDKSIWDRKHYIYPDLFNGYQISQLTDPVNVKGYIDILNGETTKRIRINRAHLENDAAKSIHGNSETLIDGNESGMPLVEIVSEPDLRTASEAVAYAKKIREIVRWSGASDCDMEKGQMRFDINVSIGLPDGKHTPISEVKNRNSFTELEDVIEFETQRQIEEYERTHEIYIHGKKVTRGWDSDKKQTFIMRTKEEANDYRYFPEPDIPTVHISREFVEDIRKSMRSSKDEYEKKLKNENLSNKQIQTLLDDNAKLNLFELTSKSFPNIVKLKIANWILGDLSFMLSQHSLSVENININIQDFGMLIEYVENKKISNTNGKLILEIMLTKDILDFKKLLEQYMVIDNTDEVIAAVQKVIESNEPIIKQIKEGKESAKQFLVGMVMKELKGKANPVDIKEIIDERLK